jgi:hypothetical protein
MASKLLTLINQLATGGSGIPGTQEVLLPVCVLASTQLSPERYLPSLGTVDTSSPRNSRVCRAAARGSRVLVRERAVQSGRNIYSGFISVAISESLCWLALSSE